MYPLTACQDTKRVVDEKDTFRIISGMKEGPPEWCDRVRDRMAELGITQEDLKDTFGVSSRGAIGHYLSGRREPSVHQFRALAMRLGYPSIEALVFGAPAAVPEAAPAAREPVAAYKVVRHDSDLIRELLAGVLTPLGLRLGRFEIDSAAGVQMEAGWADPPAEHRRGQDAVPKPLGGPGGTLPGEVVRPTGRKRRAQS